MTTFPFLLLAALPQFPSEEGAGRVLGGSWSVHPGVGVQISQYDEVVPAPDLDRDGVADVFRMPAATASGFQLEVEARSVVSGAPLWTRTLNGADKMQETDDLDGDGIGDLVASLPWEYPRGRVLALSGADGHLLWQREGRIAGNRWGEILADGADVDGDGVREVLVVDPGSVMRRPVLELLSGADGRRVASVPLASGEIIQEVLRLPRDVDGDGSPDYAVRWWRPGVYERLGALSVTTSTMLWTRDLDPGESVQAWEPDRDGDGIPELLTAATRPLPSGSELTLRSRSGAGGGVLFIHTELGTTSAFDTRLTACGDLDHDGREELLRCSAPFSASHVEVRSGADFQVLQRFYAEPGASFYAPRARMRQPGDPDGAAMLAYVTASFQLPDLQVAVAFDAALHADTASLSVTTGGTVTFEHDFPPSEAGRPCVLMVSHAAGSRRLIGSLPIPLADGGLLRTSLLLQIPGLSAPLQLLGASGDGMSTLVVPPGAPSALAGRTLWFASMTWEGTFGRRASAALPLAFH